MIITPWYKQFWPWFLFGLPGIVVIAGLTTWWIAARHADDLVADDYYKSGLAINRELALKQKAASLGITASVVIEGQQVNVKLMGSPTPPALQLHLSHPMEADRDAVVTLASTGAGLFQSRLEEPLAYRWLWKLQPLGVAADALWRLDGEVTVTSLDE